MSGQMIDRKQALRRAASAVAGLAAGLAPLAASAANPPPNDVIFTAAATTTTWSGCAPPPELAVAAEPRPEAVKDAPFSGVGTTEVVTTLADGNRIVRTNTMKFYRDKNGRTRTEYSLNAIGPFTPDSARSVVTILDPNEGKSYVLHAEMRRADVFKVGNFGLGRFSVAGGATGGARAVPPRSVTTMRSTTMVSQGVVGARGAGIAASAPLVVMSSSAPLPPPPNGGVIMQFATPPAGAAADGCKPSSKPLPSPTSLGERIIEGLKVTGTRMEFTIPQGAVGNEQPITVSSEQWFSPELGVVVSSVHRDPMMGDTTYKLEQISRLEPDVSLFTVPADYTQNEVGPNGPVFFQGRIGGGGEASLEISTDSENK